MKKMVRVLPDRLGHDQRRFRVDLGKYLHAFLLRTDETVLYLGFIRMSPNQFVAEGSDGLGQFPLHRFLSGPTSLIRRLPEVTVGDE